MTAGELAFFQDLREQRSLTVIEYYVDCIKFVPSAAAASVIKEIKGTNDLDKIRLFLAVALGDRESAKSLSEWISKKKPRVTAVSDTGSSK